MIRTVASLAFGLLIATSVFAAEPVTFKDRRITVLVGYPPGGGADATARLMAPLLAKHLPGSPSSVVENMPGADGINALNYFSKQVKPDGLTIYVGSANELDPVRSRSSVALYDLNKLNFIGGNTRFQSVIVINKLAMSRLLDRSRLPVSMGTAGFPRSGAQTAAWGIEYLGWNAKWVTGYKGTSELNLALERGEIDMTSGNTNEKMILNLISGGKVQVVTLAGMAPAGVPVVPEFANAPQIADQVEGKIRDPIAKAAFQYWLTINSVEKWLGLPGGTPRAIVETYRKAFAEVSADPAFSKGAAFLDLVLTDYRHFDEAVKILDRTPQEAVDFMSSLLRKQGLAVVR